MKIIIQGGWALAICPCILAQDSVSLLIKDIKGLWPIHTVQTSNMQYAFGERMGRFCILNFTQFSQNRLLTMKYCSVKDCNITSFCENVILHTIKV